MPALRFDTICSVLCLGAHADDIEIGCGGTLLALLASRPETHVTWVVFSTPGQREREARASAAKYLAGAMGADVITHSFRDGYFPFEGAALKDEMQLLARRLKPDVVFTHRLEDAHQDHRLLAELSWQAFREPTILEYEIPKYEGDLGRPNLFCPLPEETCRKKIDLLHSEFASQRDKPWFSAETFWSLLRLRGIECRAPSGLAEGFTCRKSVLAF
jgi:LmbE family N-acetylglucosaminyl deacetylase